MDTKKYNELNEPEQQFDHVKVSLCLRYDRHRQTVEGFGWLVMVFHRPPNEHSILTENIRYDPDIFLSTSPDPMYR